MTGEQQDTMNQLKYNIAMNYKKMQDPTSVVSPTEVAGVNQILGTEGWLTSGKTASKSLDSFKNMINREAATRVKGISGTIDAPQQSNIVTVYKNGQPYDMPADKAERALQKGFTRSP